MKENLQTFAVTNSSDNQILGYFNAKSQAEVQSVLNLKKGANHNWVIEPKPHQFGVLNWTLLDLALM